MKYKILILITTWLFFNNLSAMGTSHHNHQLMVDKPMANQKIGFLLVAPDRGSDGNDKTREVLKSLQKQFKAEALFSVGDKTKFHAHTQIAKLLQQDVDKIVILPLFYSRHNSAYKLALMQIKRNLKNKNIALSEAREFGKSYLAVEILNDKIKTAGIGKRDKIVLTGYGANTEKSKLLMQKDFKWLLKKAKRSTWSDKVAIFPTWEADDDDLNTMAWEVVESAIAGDETTQIVPMHFGKELTPMMSFDSTLSRGWNRRSKNTLKHTKVKETDYTIFWANREANRYTAIKNGKVGLLFLAHGSDYYWNETMRRTMQELSKKIPIEFSFSMADNMSISKAVKRLEKRGVNALVIVRVFGMSQSFISGINRLIGQDIEGMSHGMPSMGGMSMMMGPQKRIKTNLMITTAGGLDDDALFAEALLDKVIKKSKNPSKETVILLAHGHGTDSRNASWMNILASIATQMKGLPGGDEFRDIKFQTWREDWPLKRVARVNWVKSAIRNARKDGGRAILVASRTTGSGPADELVSGLIYTKATGGFAPHPLFNQWVEKQFASGKDKIRSSQYVMREKSGQFETTDKGEVEGIIRLMNSAISKGNSEMLFKLFDKNALSVNLFALHANKNGKNNSEKISTTKLKKQWSILLNILKTLQSYQREPNRIKVKVSGKLANAWVQINTETMSKNGLIKRNRFSEVVTLVKRESGWKIASIVNNHH